MPNKLWHESLICRHSARLVVRVLVLALALHLSGCSGTPVVQDHVFGDLGHIEVRQSDHRGEGVVIGATQGSAEPEAVEIARALSDETGAGLVIAYGFRSKRIPVAQPLVHMSPVTVSSTASRRPGSVYPQFRQLVQHAVDGPVKFYVGVRTASPKNHPRRLEVATAGLTFEQVMALKAAFIRIRDRAGENSAIAKVEIALNPLDEVSWNVTGVKNHGVLLLAKRGMILRLPKMSGTAATRQIYINALTEWVVQALRIVVRNPSQLPEMEIQLMRYGRIESIPSTKKISGIVIGAPHGSFDNQTAEFAQQLGYRTSIAVVAAKGFSPTEAGGWRINVNRPTEKLYPHSGPEQERATDRAREVYQCFRDAVFKAAAGPLDLYIDVHQNGQDDNIDVATVGISPDEAALIKTAYTEIRQRLLRGRADMLVVNMAIEPIDKVTFRARVAKEQGILRRPKKSLHFEMPAHRVFHDAPMRQAYTEIIGELIHRIVPILHSSSAFPAARLAPTSSVP